jgi:hypothetical protein
MAKTAAHSHYLLSVDAGETCAHLYLIVPKTMLVEDEDYERLAFEANFALANALLSAGYHGPIPPSPTVSKLKCESQDEVEAILREPWLTANGLMSSRLASGPCSRSRWP